jgi:hypothetical protein
LREVVARSVISSSQLRAAVDAGYVTQEVFRALAEKSKQARMIVRALRTAARRQLDARG